MYLNQKKSFVTLNELSEKLKISKNNLIKVSHQLAKFGYIETSRGRAGGLLIGKDAGKTSLRQIVSKTEENFFLADCFTGKSCRCTFIKNCLLEKSLSEALKAFMNSLDRQTLNDVTPKV
jgi:Rrf2 family nitric oxide-sensitive transcriptional repressor